MKDKADGFGETKNCPVVILPTTDLIRNGVGLNSGLSDERRAS